MANFIASNGSTDPGVDLVTTNKIGIGTTNPATHLDVNGCVALRAYTPETTGDVNDFNTGDHSVLRMSFDGPAGISGLTGGTDGRMLMLINVSPHQTFWLIDQTRSKSSTQENRIIIPHGGPWPVEPNRTVMLWYDAVDLRWRVVSMR